MDEIAQGTLRMMDYGVLGVVLSIAILYITFLIRQHREERGELVTAIKNQQIQMMAAFDHQQNQLIEVINRNNDILTDLEKAFVKLEGKLT